MIKSSAWLQDAPKMSFAAGPIEMHDARHEWPGWTKPGFDDSSWDRHVHDDMLFMEVATPEGLPWEVRPKGRLATKKLVVNGLKR